MPLVQKIQQLFLMNLEGNKTYKPIEQDEKGQPVIPGGYILFSYNIADTREQTKNFISSIKNYDTAIAPYICCDQEGGVVARLRDIAPPLFSQKKIATLYSAKEAKDIYKIQAVQMKELGIDLNLAPVVEVSKEYNKDFLGTRSFGEKQKAIDFSKACIQAYKENGIACCPKHFPGNSNQDPHTGLQEIAISKEQFKEDIIDVWQDVLSLKPACLLVAHSRVLFSPDANTPACLSRYWVTDVLKNQLGFCGLVICDDIFMGALAENGFSPQEAIQKALKAGVNVIMLSEKKIASYVVEIEKLALEDEELCNVIDESVKKILLFKIKQGIFSLENHSSTKYSNDMHLNYEQTMNEQ